MPLASKSTRGFASMMSSDSEPDFDDIQMVKVLSLRGNDGRVSAPRTNNQRQNIIANRVMKPTSRLRRNNNGGRDLPHSASVRHILLEKSVNQTLEGIPDRNYKAARQAESHDNNVEAPKVVIAPCDPDWSHKMKHDSEQNSRHDSCINVNISGAKIPELMEVDKNMDVAAISASSQEKDYRRSGTMPLAVYSHNEDEVSALRQLGELRKKYDALEARHNELRDAGITAAECNFERLKRQSQETAAASTRLVSELKAELSAQSSFKKQKEQVCRQLERSEAKVAELEKTISDLTSSLSKARSEIKSLSAKLSASRTVDAGAKMPASTTKIGGGSGKSTPSGVVQAAQAKEDLYGDLTGLIVRGTSHADSEDVFDCIQTGRNGTLHFKLALEGGENPENYDEAQFTYRPQLDAQRDSDLMMVLPDYLVEEITFTRTQASNFYSRLNKSLTGRLE